MERRLQYLNYKEIAKIVPQEIDSVFLPIGTIEAHGVTPLGTDNIIPEYLSLTLSERLNFLVAPTISYGLTHSLLPYPGSITVKEKSFYNYVLEVMISLSRIGFTKIIVINGHGGNNAVLKNVLYEFYERTGKYAAVIHWWILTYDLTEDFFGEHGAHAGIDENGMILAIDPSLVKKELYSDDDVYLYNRGINSIPIPGSIITYKNGEGKPRFNIKEAKEFKENVLNYLENVLKELLRRWNRVSEL